MTAAPDGLRIRDVVERTGVGEATLRAWEQRYGFPEPRAAAERAPPLSRDATSSWCFRSPACVTRACRRRPQSRKRAPAERAGRSRSSRGFARCARSCQVSVLPKRCLVALSHAIEDESSCAAEDLLLFGAFQRERHYRETSGAGATSAAHRR